MKHLSGNPGLAKWSVVPTGRVTYPVISAEDRSPQGAESADESQALYERLEPGIGTQGIEFGVYI